MPRSSIQTSARQLLVGVFTVLCSTGLFGAVALGASLLGSVHAGVPHLPLVSLSQPTAAEAAPAKARRDLQFYIERRRRAAERVDALLRKRAEMHASAPAKRADNKMGIYLAASNVAKDQYFVGMLDRLVAAGGSALVFDVKGSFVYFRTASPLAAQMELVLPLYDLPEVVSMAKQKGLYTIARLIAASDPVFSGRMPDVRIRHPKTGVAVGNTWVDLGHPTVLEYNRQVIRDVVSSGIDELNIDYIRYPTEYAQSAIGLTGSEKADHVEKFVRMARETIDEFGPSTRLGLSTYAILGWNYPVNLETLGQDVVRFAPLLDVISPMAYPATFAEGAYYKPDVHPRSRMYYLVYRTLTGYAELLGPAHAQKLRPWIQGYSINDRDLREEIDAVFDAGACGFTVWNASNSYESAFRVLPKLQVPERCRGQ